MKPKDNLLSELYRFYNLILEVTEKTTFDQGNSQQVYAAALHGTILSHTSAYIKLIENKQWDVLPIIFRSFLEAYAHLNCLNIDANHVKHMESADIKQELRLLNNARKAGAKNPWLEGISKLPDIDKTISERENQLEELKGKSFLPLKIDQLFQKAGLESEYHSIYLSSCNYSHHNISKIENKHFIFVDDQTLRLTINKFNSLYYGFLSSIIPG